jgi:hypothetical protein
MMETPTQAQVDAFTAKREEKDRLAQLAKRNDFDRLHFRWLEARATLENPDLDDSDVAMAAKQHALDEAGRQFLATPAFLDWMIWEKWEVLEFNLAEDVIAGRHADNRTVVALACIKADLMRLGIGNGGE